MVPSELTDHLDYAPCRYRVNADLGQCIIDTRAVIDRANADRAAIKRIATQGQPASRGTE